MQKRNIVILIIILFSVILTWNYMNSINPDNSSDSIYSWQNLLSEAIFISGGIFLIIEAKNHINLKENNLNRSIRIAIAIGVITVHLVVLLYGGYP